MTPKQKQILVEKIELAILNQKDHLNEVSSDLIIGRIQAFEVVLKAIKEDHTYLNAYL